MTESSINQSTSKLQETEARESREEEEEEEKEVSFSLALSIANNVAATTTFPFAQLHNKIQTHH